MGRVENTVDEGVRTWRIRHVQGIRGYVRTLLPYIVTRWFRRYVRLYGMPDLIHAHVALRGGFWAKRLHRLFDIPYVVTEHSSAYQRGRISKWGIWKARGVYLNAAANLAVSRSLAEYLKSNVCPERVFEVIPNPLSTNFENRLPIVPAADSARRPKRFLNVALATPNKGQDILIEAFATAFRGSDVELRIVGDGPFLSDLKKLAMEQRIASQVVFRGSLPHQQVLQEMENCDVFVLSSLRETFGVVLIEALACGKPVVATACGGPEDIVHRGNGCMVPVGSVNDLAEAMRNTQQNLQLFDAMKIRQDCLSRFGSQAVVRQLAQVYELVARESEAGGTRQFPLAP
jgi:glycosyltransferase involved in cell wall biosynthesis